ncbi:MAG: DEAD/DEAH box helicase [Candidatus Verstraetearchaeota archaeon]|jgi:superfamily II DNA/RNA helicase|nr:DEAD/DEAH box helicase [Candidatus Verstraetearchaeota archaeon]
MASNISASKRECLEDIISIYHDILLNEIAVMRANTIVEEGYNTGEAIVYFSSSYPLYTAHSNVNRGLDYLVLAYSIINGLRRLEGGYNVVKPIDPEPLCDPNKIKSRLTRVLSHIKKGLPDIDQVNLEDLIAEYVLELVDLGLLHMIPEQTNDNLNIIETRKLIEEKSNFIVAKINESKDFHALKVCLRLEEFFYRYGIDPRKLLEAFAKKLIEKVGIKQSDEEQKLFSKTYFKTLHGMLYKYSSSASSLPFNPATLESNVLPFVIEPPLPSSYLLSTSTGRQINEQEILNSIKSCIESIAKMNGVNVNNESVNNISRIIEDILIEVSKKYPKLSEYQYRYIVNMFRACGENKNVLTVITSPTGTGKTLIFLVYVLMKILIFKLLGKKAKAIIIYPRKALARDQLVKIIELVDIVNNVLKQKEKSLNIVVGIRDGDSLELYAEPTEPIELRGLRLRGFKICHKSDFGGKYTVFLSKSECDKCSPGDIIERITWLKDIKQESWKYFSEYDLVITNHSILNMLANDALKSTDYMEYKDVIGDVKIIVIDEAHVYAKENLEVLATALLKLLYTRSHILKNTIPESTADLVKDLDIIMSSATLTDQYIISKNGKKMYSGNIIGFFKLKSTYEEQETKLPTTLSEFLQNMLSEEIFREYCEHNAIIYVDYDYMIAKDLGVTQSGDSIVWKYPFRLKTALVVNPYPDRRSWTALAEILIALLHWLNSIRVRLKKLDDNDNNYSKTLGLVFIDSKSTLKDIYRTFVDRQILDAQDHADRVLLTGLYIESIKNKKPRREAEEQIIKYIDKKTRQNGCCSYELVYKDEVIRDFSVIPMYIKLNDLPLLMDTDISNYNAFSNIISKLSLYHSIRDFIEGLNGFACKLMLRYKSYKEFLKNLGGLSKNIKVILMHHGDLERKERAIIESHMKGDLSPIPYLTLSTSTMELGVDIEHVPIIVQFASEPTSVELNQRMGRSGRSLWSFYISTLILVLRNTGEDLIYSRDQEAVEYVYNFITPKTYNPYQHADIMLRHLTKIYIDECLSIVGSTDIENKLRTFINATPIRQIAKNLHATFDIWAREVKSTTNILSAKSSSQNPQKVLDETNEEIRNTLIKITANIERIIKSKDPQAVKFENDLKKVQQDLSKVKQGFERHFEAMSYRWNALPYLRLLSRIYCNVMNIEENYRSSFEAGRLYWDREIVESLINSLSGLMTCIQYQYSLYQLPNLPKDVEKYLNEKLYLFDTLTPGLIDDIGNSFCNHLLIEYTKKGGVKINMINDPIETFSRARPLNIKLGE